MTSFGRRISTEMIKGESVRRLLGLTLALLLLPSAVLAANPPKNTGKAKPPAWSKPALDWFDDHPVTPDPKAKPDPLVAEGYGSSILQPHSKRSSLTIG